MSEISRFFAHCQATSKRKSIDYNGHELDVNDPRENAFPFGVHSYGHFLITKARRLQSLIEKNDNISKEELEKFNNILVDMANYCNFFYEYLNKD